jgi:hypothetical protein
MFQQLYEREKRHTKKFFHDCLANAAASTRDKGVTAFYAKKQHLLG